jgi:uncharacterized Zn-finger protein
LSGSATLVPVIIEKLLIFIIINYRYPGKIPVVNSSSAAAHVSASDISRQNRLFTCPSCNKSYGQQNTLNRHMLIHAAVKPHQCSLCARSFTEKTVLNKHMLTHAAGNPHQCSVCDKSFTSARELKVHRSIVHSVEKLYKCTQCDQQSIDQNSCYFASQSSLKRHKLRAHSSAPP